MFQLIPHFGEELLSGRRRIDIEKEVMRIVKD